MTCSYFFAFVHVFPEHYPWIQVVSNFHQPHSCCLQLSNPYLCIINYTCLNSTIHSQIDSLPKMTYNLLLTGTRCWFVTFNVSKLKSLFISRLMYPILPSIIMADVNLQLNDLLHLLWLKISAVEIYCINC